MRCGQTFAFIPGIYSEIAGIAENIRNIKEQLIFLFIMRMGLIEELLYGSH